MVNEHLNHAFQIVFGPYTYKRDSLGEPISCCYTGLELMPENIVLGRQLLHPEQMRSDHRIILLVKQVNLSRQESVFSIGEHKIFILLHREHETPTLGLVEVPVHHRHVIIDAGDGLKVGDDFFMPVPLQVFIDGNVVIVVGAHIVNRHCLTCIIGEDATVAIQFAVQRSRCGQTGNCHPLDGNALLLVKLDGVLVKVAEGFSGIPSTALKALLQYSTHPAVHHLAQIE